jgi:hypothetical protein
MVDLFLAYGVYYDPIAGSSSLRSIPELEMVWTDEARFFTPYARQVIHERGLDASEDPPPLSVGNIQGMLELKAFYEAGGGDLIVVGTDKPPLVGGVGPYMPGFAYYRVLQGMVYAGLPPVAVLKAATMNGARALGVEDRLGSIEPGKLADLYIVSGDPLDDIKSVRNVRFVIKNGEVFDPQALLAAAEGRIGPTGPDDHDDWILRVEPLVPLRQEDHSR